MAINFQKMGSGEPMIIMHGLFGTLDNLKLIAKSLANSHTVYLIDLPGHGESSCVQPFDLPNMAKAVIEFAEEMGLTNFSILGHSLGGKVAMEVALARPDLVKSIAVADIAPVQYQRRHDAVLAGLNAIDLVNTKSRQDADKVMSQHISEIGVRAFLLKSLRRAPEGSATNWVWYFDLPHLEQSYENFIKANSEGKYSGPVLFIIGGNSEYVQPAHQEAIQNRFSNIKVKVIQNAGHWLHAEKPVAFEKICTDFFLQ